jgi:cyclopropane-fatty-acyl-phospholipid synthase
MPGERTTVVVRPHGPSTTSHWIQKYIFPGGYIPALLQVIPHVERCGLWITDQEVLRLHYANTLRLRREQFQQSREAVEKIYDARFCRMWEYYLVASEMSFRYAGFMVFQMQLARDVAAVPLTRDYLFEAERGVTPFSSFATGDLVPRELRERDPFDGDVIAARDDPAGF